MACTCITPALVLASFICVPVVRAGVPLSFAGAVNYGVGQGPFSVAAADFSRDGKADLATANFNSNTVSVLLGSGNGTFQVAVDYGTGLNPRSIAVGDFNGDGKPDLAVANFGGNNVSILLGNGNGTFQTAVNYGVGTSPTSLAIGDFNRDGKPDLAVSNFGGNNVSVLLGNGNGTFQAAVNYNTGNFPHSVAVADFNGDGKVDLAVSNNQAGNVSVLLGSGNGTFQASGNYGAGTLPTSVAAGDFNRDGKTDLVVANEGGNNVSILLGNGDGTFQAAVNYGAGSSPASVVLGDFNGDGKTDLATANGGGNNLSLLQGSGDGTFRAAVNYDAGSSPTSTAGGDFNGDGKPDLAAANAGSGNVSVLLNAHVDCGYGTFGAAVNYSAGSFPHSVSVSDFNGDGKADLAVANQGGNNVSILLGNGDGTFQAALNYGAGSSPWSLAVADFNGDGKTDLAVTNYHGNDVSVLLGNGNGTFQTAVNYSAGSIPHFVAVADFNSDGKADLAAANAGSGNVSVLLGNGDGTFQVAVNYAAGISPRSVAARDFNGDGKPDLAVANSSSNNVSVLLGNGNGTFQTAVSYSSNRDPYSVAVADFNRDGNADLAVGNSYSNNVGILLGNGDGTFQTAVNYGAGSSPWSLAAADFNGDGKADLAVANSYSNNVSVLSGGGDGTFQVAVSYGAGNSPTSVAIADFNGDSKADLAVTNFGSNNVSVLLNGYRLNISSLGSGSWSNSSTWDCRVPQLGDNVVIKHGEITLDSDVTVSGNLMLDGADLGTGAFTLTMPAAAATSGTGDVVGTVKRTGFVPGGSTLSFGNPSTTVQINSGTAPADISVNLAKSAPTGDIAFPNAVNRTYVITPAGSSGFAATVRLHYLDAELNGNAEANLGLWRFKPAQGWKLQGKTANDATANWVELSGVTEFSPWTLGPWSATTTTVSPLSATYSTAPQTVMLTATVTSPSGMVNGGTVTFTVKDAGNNTIGQAATSAEVWAGNADATFQIPAGQAAGTYTIHADYSGFGSFAASIDHTRSLTITKAAATITLNNLTHTYDGTPKSAGASTTPPGLSGVTFTYDGSVTPPTNAGSYALVAALDHPNYSAPNATGTFVISKAAQAIVFNALPAKIYGDTPFTVSATGGGSGNPVTFAAAPPGVCGSGGTNGVTISIAGAGTCTVTASQAGNSNYNAAPDAMQSFLVAKAGQAITFGTLPARTYGDPPFTVSATGGGSGNPVTFAAAPAAVCTAGAANGSTITIAGAGGCTVTASQAGNANYTAAPEVLQNFYVNAASTTTAISAPRAAYGADGAVTVTVSSTAGTPSGIVSLSVDGGAASFKILNAVPGSLPPAASATFTIAKPSLGIHPLSSYYAAQGNFASSSAAGSLVVGYPIYLPLIRKNAPP